MLGVVGGDDGLFLLMWLLVTLFLGDNVDFVGVF